LADVGINFESKSGTGTADSKFSWDLSCENLGINENKTYKIYFVSGDKDECKEINQDTLTYTLSVNVPFNNKPLFDVDTYFELEVNELFNLDLLVTDLDEADLISVDVFSEAVIPPSESFSFTKMTGKRNVVAPLSWTPECDLLGAKRAPKTYTVYFLAWDDNCPNFKSDTLAINFEVRELDVDYDGFLPPNAFSPNGDGINDTYSLFELPIRESNLPPDNCADQFQSIVIFDRSGNNVFTSKEREFVWTGVGAAPGSYFYQIDYLNTKYKGVLTLVR
jgi:gliding motility-associated-like protein